jgi:primosomal protein N' (replication factor Y) (superfamily II helicase)
MTAQTRWRVAVPLPIPAYDFRPAHGADSDALGKRVLVPWQGGARVGLVVEVVTDDRAERHLNLKDAIAVLDELPVLNADGCASLLEIARACFCFEGIAYQDFVPWGMEPAIEHLARLVPGVSLENLPSQAKRLRDWTSAPLHDPGILEFLRGQGLLEEEVALLRPTKEVVQIVEGLKPPKLTAKQSQALEVLTELRELESGAAWATAAGVGTGVVTKLLELGLAARVRVPNLTAVPETQDLTPPRKARPEDLETVRQLEGHGVVRLHGGRFTDRFAAVAELIRRTPGGVLYLAPDGSRLQRAFQALGGLRSSALFSGELKHTVREAVWRAAARGEVELVFGTPFSLLMPVRDLQLIIVEDELSDAWKLQSGSRAFVAEIAKIRAHHSGARLLYTGSVPASESLELPGVTLPAPRARLHVVDLSAQQPAPETGPLSNFKPPQDSFPISTALKRVLRQIAERGRQAVVIAPRRGYSALIRCKDCGWLPFCPNCDVPLRYHLETRGLECHQCGHHERPPTRCPTCDGTVLSPRGPGSQWIQRELEKLLPGTRVYRFDKDKRDDLERIYRGEPGVIVGTTAVLALQAPPDLALIALSFADTMHTNPDFRAGERYHFVLRQLLEWHPTRAPLTLVQTFQGSHPALKSILSEDDASAYPSTELPNREAFHYPPFTRLAQVQVAARRQQDAEVASSKLGALIRDRGADNMELLGPAPAPIARLKGLYAFQLLVRAPNLERLSHLLEPARNFREGGVRTRVEMNPRQLDDLLE